MPKLPQLRAVRESRMMSQEMLAERANVTQATVSRIENGQGAQYETVRKLARVLRVKTADLVGPDQPTKALLYSRISTAEQNHDNR